MKKFYAILFILFAFSFVLGAHQQAGAATDMFVQFDGIYGDSNDEQHLRWSDVHSYSEGLSVSIEPIGGTTRAGKVKLNDVIITKALDSASASLRSSAAGGTKIGSVKIHFAQAEESRHIYLEIELQEVLITGISMSASTSDTQKVEEISLAFTRMNWKYIPIENGKPGKPIEFNYDFEQTP